MKKIILVALSAFVLQDALAKSSIEEMRAQALKRTGGNNPYAAARPAGTSSMLSGKVSAEQEQALMIQQQGQAYIQSLHSVVTPEAKAIIGLTEEALSERLDPAVIRQEAREIASSIKQKLNEVQLADFSRVLEEIYSIVQDVNELRQNQTEQQLKSILAKLSKGAEDPLFAAVIIYFYEMPLASILMNAISVVAQQKELPINPEAIQKAQEVIVVFVEELISSLNNDC